METYYAYHSAFKELSSYLEWVAMGGEAVFDVLLAQSWKNILFEAETKLIVTLMTDQKSFILVSSVFYAGYLLSSYRIIKHCDSLVKDIQKNL